MKSLKYATSHESVGVLELLLHMKAIVFIYSKLAVHSPLKIKLQLFPSFSLTETLACELKSLTKNGQPIIEPRGSPFLM